MNPSLAHETITIDRTIKASPEIVFEAWAKPEARAIWGVPSEDEALEFIENDFRAGGMDVHMCGQKGDLRFRVETLYHEIQEPLRLLFTERVSTSGNILCASLVAVDLAKAGASTRLILTVQIASLVGAEMIEGNRGGWNSALANLEMFLAERRGVLK